MSRNEAGGNEWGKGPTKFAPLPKLTLSFHLNSNPIPEQVLGRAPNIKYFVRLGQSDAYIKIEIKGKEGRPNLVIKREFNKDTDKSVFYMNGESGVDIRGDERRRVEKAWLMLKCVWDRWVDEKTTGQKVTDAVQALGIQVNNMWYVPIAQVSIFSSY